MAVGGTTVGPVTTETRDLLKEYRDQHGHGNYEEAIQSLLATREEGV